MLSYKIHLSCNVHSRIYIKFSEQNIFNKRLEVTWFPHPLFPEVPEKAF